MRVGESVGEGVVSFSGSWQVLLSARDLELILTVWAGLAAVAAGVRSDAGRR